jgi:hypothetical protein
MENMTVEKLAGLLRAAEKAHFTYSHTVEQAAEPEKTLAEWPEWYAAYILHAEKASETPKIEATQQNRPFCNEPDYLNNDEGIGCSEIF